MRQAAAFRGQPLLVLAGVLVAWFGLRVLAWQPLSSPAASGAAGRPGVALHRVPWAAGANKLPAGARGRGGPRAVTIAFGWPVPARSAAREPLQRLPRRGALTMAAEPEVVPPRLAVGHTLLLTAGLSRIELPPTLAAYFDGTGPALGVPAAPSLLAGLPAAAPSASARLSADAWLMLRQDAASSGVSGRPSYGRGQAGGVIRYRLARSADGPQAYLGARAALQGPAERGLVVGLAARPVSRFPLRVAAEVRIDETAAGVTVRPALAAVTEFPRFDLPLGARGEVYLQGGYVAGRFATAFVDGQARVERPLARRGQAEVTAGAGVWGGAQKGAARLDAGPTAAVGFRLGEARGRVGVDYRWRVAGHAEPRSGAALTLSAGF